MILNAGIILLIGSILLFISIVVGKAVSVSEYPLYFSFWE